MVHIEPKKRQRNPEPESSAQPEAEPDFFPRPKLRRMNAKTVLDDEQEQILTQEPEPESQDLLPERESCLPLKEEDDFDSFPLSKVCAILWRVAVEDMNPRYQS